LIVLAVLVAPAFACGAASILSSVWCRKTRDAVLRLYAVLAGILLLVALVQAVLPPGLGTLSGPLPGILRFFNPLYVLEPVWTGGGARELLGRWLGSLFAWGLLGVGCLEVAVWRLRPAYLRQLENIGKAKKTWLSPRRPAVGNNPLRWKDQYVEGVA